MDRRGFLAWTTAGLALGAFGCGADGDGPFGATEPSPLLTPFQGTWACDVEATLAARKAAGSTDNELATIRSLLNQDPMIFPLHPDLAISGVVAVGQGRLESEYRFFALHRHGDVVCGKAWHHEDRSDPGDMSACRVRLQLIDSRLHLSVRMQDGLPDLNSPDLVSMPVEADAGGCDAEKPRGEDWSGWELYVFHRS